jgi:hypothetical protein
VLKPNDRVVIRLARFALNRVTRDADEIAMVGFIDSITEHDGVDAATGRPTPTVTITGTDYAKLFRQFKVSHDNYLQGINDVLFLSRVNDIPIRPHDGDQINAILDWINSNGLVGIRFGPGFQLVRKIQNNYLIVDGRFLAYQGDLWGLFSQLANPPFNELFCDTIDGRGTLVFRPTPFDPSEFRALKRHTLDLQYRVSNRNLTLHDGDVCNVFRVFSQAFGIPLTAKPTVLAESLRLFGLRYFAPHVTIVSYAAPAAAPGGALTPPALALNRDVMPAKEELESSVTDMSAVHQELQQKLVDWFGHNEELKSGSLPIVGGMPEAHIGETAVFPDIGEIYYIEGVQHRFEMKRSAVTVLQLTRGQSL